jgi:hypothetical protein
MYTARTSRRWPSGLRAGRARVGAWQTRPPTAEACAPTDFVLKVAAIQGAPPERMDVRVTRAWPTTGTYGQRLLDWCCSPTGRVLPSDRQAP